MTSTSLILSYLNFLELTYLILLASCIFNCFHLVKIWLIAYEITHSDSCNEIHFIAFHVLTTHFVQQMETCHTIDGYSRIPVFLHCSDSNEATTVLQLFKTAVHKYSFPSHIRTDKGGENSDVAMFLLMHPLRGPGRGTVIVGKSTHNQRIE